jgi:hypothetical protein
MSGVPGHRAPVPTLAPGCSCSQHQVVDQGFSPRQRPYRATFKGACRVPFRLACWAAPLGRQRSSGRAWSGGESMSDGVLLDELHRGADRNRGIAADREQVVAVGPDSGPPTPLPAGDRTP